MDSLSTMLVFAILNVLLFFKFLTVWLKAYFKTATKSMQKLRKYGVLAFVLVLLFAAISVMCITAIQAFFELSQNLGLFYYNHNFSYTYDIHAYGLTLFVILFYFFFYRELDDAIRKIIKTYKRDKRLAI